MRLEDIRGSRSPARGKPRARILAAVVGATLAAAVFAPVSATASSTSCDTGDVCVYNSTWWAADAYTHPPTNPWSAFSGKYANMDHWPPHTYNVPSYCNDYIAGWQTICNLNDSISSAKNRDYDYKVRLFVHANWAGAYNTLLTRTSNGNLSNSNKISSLCWIGGSITVSTCQS